MSSSDPSKGKDPVEELVGELVDEQLEEETPAAEEAESTDDSEKMDPEAMDIDDLRAALEAAGGEISQFRDQALRAEAEMQNVRRRAERDVESAHKYGLEKFLQNLLPVVDSLEKAVEAVEGAGGDSEQDSEQDKAVLEGVKLCLKMFHDVIARERVEIVDPHGEPFDPKFHEAITMIEHEEMEPNSVVSVIQKGYKLNERLVRPAMVVVSKAAEKSKK